MANPPPVSSLRMPYEVSTPVFEGPFDLLLHLITQQQVDLWEVSISSIVDAYLAELERMRSVDLEVATEFVLVAATLVQLKCRRLLPGPEDVDVDDEVALYEERDLLLARLLECYTFKEAAGALQGLIERASRALPRQAGPDERFSGVGPDPMDGVDVARLRDLAAAALAPRPAPKVEVAHISPITLSVVEVARALVSRLSGTGRATFRDLTSGAPRLEVVVSFLALLELYRQGLVELAQTRSFGELEISWTGAHAGSLSGVGD
jgi:segregation and condensation protein A